MVAARLLRTLHIGIQANTVSLLAYSPSIWKIADSESDKTKAMTITLVFAAHLHSTHTAHHEGVRENTEWWLGVNCIQQLEREKKNKKKPLMVLIITGKYFPFMIYNTYNYIDGIVVGVLAPRVR